MKKIVCVVLVLIMAISVFAGCSKDGGKPNDNPAPIVTQAQGQPSQTNEANPGANTPSTPEATEQQHVRITKEEQVALEFVQALLKKDYEKAVALFECNVDGGADFVSKEDVEWVLPRSAYKDLSYFNPETAEYTTALNTYGNVDVTVKDNAGENQTFTVKIAYPKNGDGSPMVNGVEDFYRVDYSFRTPSNVKVEIDGVELDKSLISQRNSGTLSMGLTWTIPVIGIKDKEIRVSCDNFDYAETVTPKSHATPNDDASCRIFPDYDDEDVLVAIKDLWNGMYEKASVDDAKASDLYDFVATDASPDEAQNILDGYKKLDESDKDPKVTQAVYRSDGQCFWIDDHHLVINFGYELVWTSYGSTMDMKRLSNIVLAKEEGGWKVFRVTDSDLFSNANQFTNEW